MIPTSNGNLFVAGGSTSDISFDKTENSIGEFDFWVMMLSSDPAVGINEISEKTTLQIFPNPTSGEINIISPTAYFKEGALEIYNVTGQLVYSEEIIERSSNKKTINLSHLNSGLYQIVLMQKNKAYRAKVIVSR